MSSSYDRSFNAGRQSELLYNEELHKIYESIKHLLDTPTGKVATPDAKLDGSLWLDRTNNALKTWQKSTNTWVKVFDKEFRILSEINNPYPPSNPILGQFWNYNGTLVYYNGSEWTPFKTLVADSLDIDISLFQNFLLISPMKSSGSTVMDPDMLESYDRQLELYKQGKIDYDNEADIKASDKWKFGDDIKIDTGIDMESLQGVEVQYLVPDTLSARVFLDGQLNTDYKEKSRVCIQYPAKTIENTNSGLVHINPGRLQGIHKTLVKVDRITAELNFDAANYELYGFKKGSPFGEFLLPEHKENDGGYIRTEKGVILSYQQVQNYDYILIVSYDFGWLKMTGKLRRSVSDENSTTYRIPNFKTPLNIFVDGFNLEETGYSVDNIAKTITINENTRNMVVNGFETAFREMGFVRRVDVNGAAVIKVTKKYARPIVFLNGEAIDVINIDNASDINYDTSDQVGYYGSVNGTIYDRRNNIIRIPEAKIDMVWAVAELKGDTHNSDPDARDFDMFVSAGIVDEDGVVPIPDDTFIETDRPILFVNGLYIDTEDIVIEDGKIFCNGIEKGMDYILLRDRYKRLFDKEATQKSIGYAINVGRFNESLVYYNGYLILNQASLIESKTPGETVPVCNGEIKFFVTNEARDEITNLVTTTGRYYVYAKKMDDYGNDISGWEPIDEEKLELDRIAKSYSNAVNAVYILSDNLADSGIVYDRTQDKIDVFGYKFAAYDETPLKIGNIEVTEEEVEIYNQQRPWVNAKKRLQKIKEDEQLEKKLAHMSDTEKLLKKAEFETENEQQLRDSMRELKLKAITEKEKTAQIISDAEEALKTETAKVQPLTNSIAFAEDSKDKAQLDLEKKNEELETKTADYIKAQATTIEKGALKEKAEQAKTKAENDLNDANIQKKAADDIVISAKANTKAAQRELEDAQQSGDAAVLEEKQKLYDEALATEERAVANADASLKNRDDMQDALNKKIIALTNATKELEDAEKDEADKKAAQEAADTAKVAAESVLQERQEECARLSDELATVRAEIDNQTNIIDRAEKLYDIHVEDEQKYSEKESEYQAKYNEALKVQEEYQKELEKAKEAVEDSKYKITAAEADVYDEEQKVPEGYRKQPNMYTEDFQNFIIPERFEPNHNLISVYVDGLMQSGVKDHADGFGFELPEQIKTKAHISYVIETPAQLSEKYVQRIVLNENNAVKGASNVYRTYKQNKPKDENAVSLYPGRVTIFIDGVRQPQDSYVILDNYTIMFKDDKHTLIGNDSNYPDEILLDDNHLPIVDEKGRYQTIHHKHGDNILVEIRQDLNKVENHIQSNKSKTAKYSVNVQDHNIPAEILDSSDEILIYINGLFAGLKLNDGMKYAYTRDINQGTISILDPSVSRILIDDSPLIMQKKCAIQERDDSMRALKIAQVSMAEWKEKAEKASSEDSETAAAMIKEAEEQIKLAEKEIRQAEDKIKNADKAMGRYNALYGEEYKTSPIDFIFEWRNA